MKLSYLRKKLSFIGHLIKISIQLVQFGLQFPLGSSYGLVDITKVSKIFIGVSKLLLSSTTLTVSSLQESPGLLQTIGHSGSSRFSRRLIIYLELGFTDLSTILLDGGLSLSISSNSMLQCQLQIGRISLQLLLHS